LLKIALASLSAAGIACTAAPAAEQLQTIAPGVRVFGARVGGLTLEPARHRIQTALGRPIAIVYRGEVLTVTPKQLGAKARVDVALRSALSARAHSRIALHVGYSQEAVAGYVAKLARQYDRKPRPATVVGATARGPVIREGKVGLAVEQPTLNAALVQQLATGARRPLVLLMHAVPPQRTAANIGPVIVVNRATNASIRRQSSCADSRSRPARRSTRPLRASFRS
jgi:vancomycin resistance protein YoaR